MAADVGGHLLAGDDDARAHLAGHDADVDLVPPALQYMGGDLVGHLAALGVAAAGEVGDHDGERVGRHVVMEPAEERLVPVLHVAEHLPVVAADRPGQADLRACR
jgi:hypothetical protein